jgi:hypothetical protein
MQARLNTGIPIDLDSMPPAMRATIEKGLEARRAAAADREP